ncbi:hypothetical protein PILCRDRAFT_98745 [Piloderma croceum F 1598]|uniref:Peptidase S54 rhomboid domain-containing protein n=1 Tax=Piloderma croceum (strain F 1598) TaxID=765440 RepID=A0A0C3BGA5_PILCF|nr:hypothetical protein PILCRDRAFT_98745 [Piloderma croceum F 1598]
MSFEHAPVSKGLMLTCAATSIIAGIFDVKHYLHLQLIPHISRHYQYWRLFAHHLAFSNSSDLLVAELILWNVGVHIERQFGSIKYASFAVVSTLLATIFEFVGLLLFHRIGLNHISSGPSSLVFSILYQYFRIVPSAYQFRIFGVHLSNKTFMYILASQLVLGHLPGSAASAIIGILTGQIYRSELANLKAYRISPAVVGFSTRFLLPLIGSTRPPRRLNRALPDEARTILDQEENEEVITTARPSATASEPRGRTGGPATGGTGGSVVREWVNELTGRTERENAGIRVPNEAEITQLTSMFPDLPRQTVIGALQRRYVVSFRHIYSVSSSISDS